MCKSSSIIVAGDLLPWNINSKLFESGDAETLFGPEVCKLFANSDFSIVNLEGPLTNATKKQTKIGPAIKASPKTINAVKNLGIKAVALANNHITDYLQVGYDDTIATLDSMGIASVGAGPNKNSIKRYITVSIGDRKVCVYNVSETFFNVASENSAGVNVYDEYLVCNELKMLKQTHDYVMVIYHGGAEGLQYPTPMLRQRFHRMADCGADFITAQHTHCIGCEEHYNGAYLLYGQGNFSFAKELDMADMMKEGLVVEVSFDQKVELKLHKVRMTSDGCIHYAEDQGFNDLRTRSQRIGDEVFIEEQYKALKSDELVNTYLLAYKGHTFCQGLLRRFFAKRYLYSIQHSYSKNQIMRNMFAIQSDRINEDMLYVWLRVLDGVNPQNNQD